MKHVAKTLRIWRQERKELILYRPLRDQDPGLGAFESVDVMESTGYKDSQGREIFEGDICVIQDHAELYVVHWGPFNDCCIRGWTWLVGLYYSNSVHSEKEQLFVVGNVYENPDLAARVEGYTIVEGYGQGTEIE